MMRIAILHDGLGTTNAITLLIAGLTAVTNAVDDFRSACDAIRPVVFHAEPDRHFPAPRARCTSKSLRWCAGRPRRPQSRRCHMDARRWKRRRFVQALRRSA
jgi:hypothetical protein